MTGMVECNNAQCRTPLVKLALPEGMSADGARILLHSCCAPCSGAIIECMLANGMHPTIFFSNSNIVPFEEYELRKAEIVRYATKMGLEVIDDDYNHDEWLDFALERGFLPAGINPGSTCANERSKELACMPERRGRCLNCFKFRLLRAARYASENGYDVLTTTLASSRWKDLVQVDEAGRWACEAIVTGTGLPGVDGLGIDGSRQSHAEAGKRVIWWNQNWRKGGLQPRRSEIIKEEGFYNQDWCGCEFSKKVLEI